jgi:hypothetical protein
MSGLMEGIQHGLGSCDVTEQVGGDELVDGGKWVGNVDLQQEQKDGRRRWREQVSWTRLMEQAREHCPHINSMLHT